MIRRLLCRLFGHCQVELDDGPDADERRAVEHELREMDARLKRLETQTSVLVRQR